MQPVTAGEGRRRISAAYLEYAGYYVGTRHGTLATTAEPEYP